MAALVTLLLVNASAAHGAESVTDESIRLRVLRLVFPNAAISRSLPGVKQTPVQGPLGIDAFSESFRDALEDEQEYDVVGSVGKDEALAAEDITSSAHDRFSEKRRVRLLLFRWRSNRGDQSSLVAVINYSFSEANPARCCLAVGKVVLLSDTGDRVLSMLDRMPNAFTTFTAIKFLSAGGAGRETLFLSVDFGGAGTIGINTAIIDLSNQRLTPLRWLPTAISYDIEEKFTMALDEPRTKRSKGKRVWFIKTTYAKKGKRFPAPVTSRESIEIGTKAVRLDW